MYIHVLMNLKVNIFLINHRARVAQWVK